MAALVQQLDHYSKVGIPKVQHQDYQVPFPFPEDEVEEGELGWVGAGVGYCPPLP